MSVSQYLRTSYIAPLYILDTFGRLAAVTEADNTVGGRTGDIGDLMIRQLGPLFDRTGREGVGRFAAVGRVRLGLQYIYAHRLFGAIDFIAFPHRAVEAYSGNEHTVSRQMLVPSFFLAVLQQIICRGVGVPSDEVMIIRFADEQRFALPFINRMQGDFFGFGQHTRRQPTHIKPFVRRISRRGIATVVIRSLVHDIPLAQSVQAESLFVCLVQIR